MKRIFLVLNCGMGGSFLGGIVGLFGGAKQSAEGYAAQGRADKEYQEAENDIPLENDSLQVGTYNKVNRLMNGYRSGAGYAYADDTLSKGTTTGANTVEALAGGNTGSALAAINSVTDSSMDAFDKLLYQNEAKGTHLLDTDVALSDQLLKRNDNIKMTKAQFKDMRANQDESLALSLKKSGQENTAAGATAVGDAIGSFGSMGQGGGEGGGGGGMMSGMMSMFGGGK